MHLTKDLTQGNLYKHLATLSIPLLFGNILQQFYNTIDAFVVGRFAGNEQFAAIGIASTIMNLFLFILVGACSGLSVLFAHYYGLRDLKKLHQQHFISLVFGLGVSIGLSILSLIFLKFILIFIQTPSNLFDFTYSYLWWIFLALPASFLYNMYASALRASGDTIAALLILAIAVCMNLVLDLFFVIYLNKGVQGAAIATCITQCGSAIFCILYLICRHKEFLFTKEDCIFDPFLCRFTLQCSSAMALQQCNLYIGKLLIQGIINTGGTNIISAYTAATRIEGFINSFGDSGSTSTSILISQNHGANKLDRVKEAYHCSFKYLGFLGIVCSIILFFSSNQTIQFMLGTNQSDAYIYGVQYLTRNIHKRLI